jgi:hypothetical protein
MRLRELIERLKELDWITNHQDPEVHIGVNGYAKTIGDVGCSRHWPEHETVADGMADGAEAEMIITIELEAGQSAAVRPEQ